MALTLTIAPPESDVPVHCPNCGHITFASRLVGFPDVPLPSGRPVPAGGCPSCGVGYAFPIESGTPMSVEVTLSVTVLAGSLDEAAVKALTEILAAPEHAVKVQVIKSYDIERQGLEGHTQHYLVVGDTATAQ